ncbi:MAG: Uncharacterised protein [Bacteroidetes bacterium MED-G17]|nr:MAG: Uncharacterised protein [Bacteroidetes bacterium MED-G17]
MGASLPEGDFLINFSKNKLIKSPEPLYSFSASSNAAEKSSANLEVPCDPASAFIISGAETSRVTFIPPCKSKPKFSALCFTSA